MELIKLRDMVYKIDCPRCKSSYIGQTSRILLRRTREHLGNRGIVRAHLDKCGVDHSSIENFNEEHKTAVFNLFTDGAFLFDTHKTSQYIWR